MNETEFWNIISLFDWDKTGDDDAIVAPLVDHLSKMKDEDIFGFEEMMSQKLHALDTIQHAKEIGEDAYSGEGKSYFSVDWFLYCRCVVVANGKAFFEHVLAKPKEFPKDMEFEALLYIVGTAYTKKHGKEWDYIPKVSYETFQNKEGWKE